MQFNSFLLPRLIVAAILFGAAALTVSCGSAPRHDFAGRIAGIAVETALDSPDAVAFAVRHQGTEAVQGQVWAKRVTARFDHRPLDTHSLQQLARETSVDTAAIYFTERIMREHAALNTAFRQEVARLRAGNAGITAASATAPYQFLFVPGFHYQTNTTTGADLARQRHRLAQAGYDVRLVAVDEDGVIERNAAIIAASIHDAARDGRPIILVSASKGGAETAFALGRLLDAETAEAVKAWVSVGGLLRGTYLADHAQAWPRSWFARLVAWHVGFDAGVIADLTVVRNRPRFASLNIPQHIMMVQYIGVPLSGQVARDVHGRYRELSRYGPNDGLTTLADQLIPGGHVIVDLGLDHFFRDPDIDLKTLAFANLITAFLSSENDGNASRIFRSDIDRRGLP